MSAASNVTLYNTPEAAAVAKIIADRPLVLPRVDLRDVILVPDGNGAMRTVTGETLFPVPMKPERRRGTATLETLESFIAHANRHKGESTVLYATRGGGTSPSIQVVFDYHRAGEESVEGELARFGTHRAAYAFPLSKEWLAWSEISKRGLTQAEFATFLEDRIGDVTTAVGEGMKDTITRLFIPSLATGARLLDLSRGLDIGENVRVSNHVKLASGETRVSFSSEHVGQDGNQVDVPQAFAIGIPVFDRGQPFQLLVRLRYRLKDNKITWLLQPHAMDEVLAFAFDEACGEAREGTGLQLFIGAPER